MFFQKKMLWHPDTFLFADTYKIPPVFVCVYVLFGLRIACVLSFYFCNLLDFTYENQAVSFCAIIFLLVVSRHCGMCWVTGGS